ncbi:Granulocyte-macrophage colony-stimulating factor receptor subunit alpha [Pteropus alecto]|uniref:Granulocyte-macrophage colony-stimulating factor receptor subunit alpha n=1 Tax=Pteropus alecto TaxID=9402 RepID=L5KBG3_PTEAL|nr:Granulocyte-macrophage colony-stimulating factor receptor subunit alpha [Pteropus alecto]
MTLCWDCGGDTTAVGCQILHKEEGPVTIKLAEKPCSHSFWNFVLHAGITFNVTAIAGQRQIAERLSFTNAGQEGTAAQSFSCFIYNVHFMNCSWTKGPAAPDDVQYFLYVQDSKKQWGRECPHYVRESGTHVGCHVPDVSSWASQAYFLVNGTSRHAKIQFFDSFLWLKTIERCNPPGNISVLCNATHCRILWEKPRTRRRLSDRDFQYQLQVQQEIELPGDLGNKYHLLSPQPRAAHTLRIRAADTRVLQWSAWSQPVTFGSQESRGRFVYVYVLVVLGTVVCVLAVSCLIQR